VHLQILLLTLAVQPKYTLFAWQMNYTVNINLFLMIKVFTLTFDC
jgi:hypothetical protein